eukprot:CAMPEP_0184644724 /NCGR_PEP_ID=MMETSP0308-20130426/1394_1 /TAXON_ID=38269 /ORGANISM="Gloeochaete witrockiana, Strain SAG 46.84" /LENGTH=158 /DNA_ID=CAMNT_0027073409 /DNA_START=255 /DNA_END=732 /DNA_ORIENTATION=+
MGDNNIAFFGKKFKAAYTAVSIPPLFQASAMTISATNSEGMDVGSNVNTEEKVIFLLAFATKELTAATSREEKTYWFERIEELHARKGLEHTEAFVMKELMAATSQEDKITWFERLVELHALNLKVFGRSPVNSQPKSKKSKLTQKQVNEILRKEIKV